MMWFSRRMWFASLPALVGALVLLYLAARHGWLGADVGRGAEFCEAARKGWLRQPANAYHVVLSGKDADGDHVVE